MTLESGPYVIVADEQTGFITHLTAKRGPLASVESWFRAPVEYSGGIRFPNEIVTANYQQDRLNRLEVMVIEEAQFNTELPADALALSVKPGVKVFDNREGGGRPVFFQPRQAIADVKAEIDLARFPPEAASPFYRRVIFGILFLVFAILLFWAIRKWSVPAAR